MVVLMDVCLVDSWVDEKAVTRVAMMVYASVGLMVDGKDEC